MSEEVNLAISQFVDGELAPNDALKLLQSMQEDRELENVYRRYEAVGWAMRSNVFLTAESDFVARVSAQIKDEPTVLCPMMRPRLQYGKTIIAVAASFAGALAVVAGVLQYRELQRNVDIEVARRQALEQIYADSANSQVRDARFKEYLEEHGATLYSGDYAESEAHGQLAGYGRQ